MAVSDAAGRLLWVEGHAGALRRAERMNFVEGAAWDEAHAGTNAPGTALALDHEVQIFATEHFRHTVQDWTCAAAPIHDAETGRRSTSSSASLEADDRPSRTSQPQSRTKMRQSRRRDTDDHNAVRLAAVVAGHRACRLLAPHNLLL